MLCLATWCNVPPQSKTPRTLKVRRLVPENDILPGSIVQVYGSHYTGKSTLVWSLVKRLYSRVDLVFVVSPIEWLHECYECYKPVHIIRDKRSIIDDFVKHRSTKFNFVSNSHFDDQYLHNLVKTKAEAFRRLPGHLVTKPLEVLVVLEDHCGDAFVHSGHLVRRLVRGIVQVLPGKDLSYFKVPNVTTTTIVSAFRPTDLPPELSNGICVSTMITNLDTQKDLYAKYFREMYFDDFQTLFKRLTTKYMFVVKLGDTIKWYKATRNQVKEFRAIWHKRLLPSKSYKATRFLLPPSSLIA